MNKLITVIPYHTGDLGLVKNLLTWISEIGGANRHAVLIGDAAVQKEERVAVKELAKKAFASVEAMGATVGSVDPKNMGAVQDAANRMFGHAANHIYGAYRDPFLWLEPDSVPMNGRWFTDLETAYFDQPKRYMGHIMITDSTVNKDPSLPKVTMSGVAVYPNDAIRDIGPVLDKGRAWDMAAAGIMVPRATHTSLIFHFWGGQDTPLIFVESRADGDPSNHVTQSFVPKDAVLFHRCKDGSLIDILRKHRKGVKKQEVKLPVGVTKV